MRKICIITTVHTALDTRIFYREAVSLRKKYEVVLIAPSEKDFEKNNIEIRSLGSSKNRLARFFKGFSALKAALNTRADVFHFHDPELIPVGLILKVFFHKRVIYDVHENNPEYILDKKWIPTSILRKSVSIFVKFLENFSAGIFDGVIEINEILLKRFKRKITSTT